MRVGRFLALLSVLGAPVLGSVFLNQTQPYSLFRLECPVNTAIRELNLTYYAGEATTVLPVQFLEEYERSLTNIQVNVSDVNHDILYSTQCHKFPSQEQQDPTTNASLGYVGDNGFEDCRWTNAVIFDSSSLQSCTICTNPEYLAGYSRVFAFQNEFIFFCCKKEGRKRDSCVELDYEFPTSSDPLVVISDIEESILASLTLLPGGKLKANICSFSQEEILTEDTTPFAPPTPGAPGAFVPPTPQAPSTTDFVPDVPDAPSPAGGAGFTPEVPNAPSPATGGAGFTPETPNAPSPAGGAGFTPETPNAPSPAAGGAGFTPETPNAPSPVGRQRLREQKTTVPATNGSKTSSPERELKSSTTSHPLLPPGPSSRRRIGAQPPASTPERSSSTSTLQSPTVSTTSTTSKSSTTPASTVHASSSTASTSIEEKTTEVADSTSEATTSTSTSARRFNVSRSNVTVKSEIVRDPEPATTPKSEENEDRQVAVQIFLGNSLETVTARELQSIGNNVIFLPSDTIDSASRERINQRPLLLVVERRNQEPERFMLNTGAAGTTFDAINEPITTSSQRTLISDATEKQVTATNQRTLLPNASLTTFGDDLTNLTINGQPSSLLPQTAPSSSTQKLTTATLLKVTKQTTATTTTTTTTKPTTIAVLAEKEVTRNSASQENRTDIVRNIIEKSINATIERASIENATKQYFVQHIQQGIQEFELNEQLSGIKRFVVTLDYHTLPFLTVFFSRGQTQKVKVDFDAHVRQGESKSDFFAKLALLQKIIPPTMLTTSP